MTQAAFPENLGVAGTAVGALLRAGLSRPVNSLNAFSARINTAIQTPIQKFNRDLITQANPYASQGVLSRMSARADPVLSCDWIAAVLGPSPEIPWEYIDTFSAPSMDADVHSHMVNGIPVKTASTTSIGSITLGLYSDINATSINWALSWWRGVHRVDGYFNLPSQYKKDIVLFLLDAKRKTVVDFRFIGCFPTSYGSYDLGADSTILVTNLTLSVDDVTISADNDLTAASLKIGSLFPQFPQLVGFSG